MRGREGLRAVAAAYPTTYRSFPIKLSETSDVDAVFSDFVIEDTFGGDQQPSGFGPAAVGGLQGILQKILFESRNGLVKR